MMLVVAGASCLRVAVGLGSVAVGAGLRDRRAGARAGRGGRRAATGDPGLGRLSRAEDTSHGRCLALDGDLDRGGLWIHGQRIRTITFRTHAAKTDLEGAFCSWSTARATATTRTS